MCGIIAATMKIGVEDVLLAGLQNMEYRGYDSVGIAMHHGKGFNIEKAVGKVKVIHKIARKKKLSGTCGIAHTRWATHGEVNKINAHPHHSGNQVVLVHNGIIENHQSLRTILEAQGYQFNSETDSEVIAHWIDWQYRTHNDLLTCCQSLSADLRGSYSLAMMHATEPGCIIGVRCGSPLVIALTDNGYILASDINAVTHCSSQFIYLEEGDAVSLTAKDYSIYDSKGNVVSREIITIDATAHATDKGKYKHYMQKEIWEQPEIFTTIMWDIIQNDNLCFDQLKPKEHSLLANVEAIHIVACGTSCHAALVARYWFEEILEISCSVEIASEYRYREVAVPSNTLLVAISQSGETADTLAALRRAVNMPYLARWVICNADYSSMTREADTVLLTQAGVEIGVASTKAFTAQLLRLLFLCLAIQQARHGSIKNLDEVIVSLQTLSGGMNRIIAQQLALLRMAKCIRKAQSALFLGRGLLYPIAMEGALKLKEISYIHAEAYAAGELKHGALALIDKNMPTVALVGNGTLLDKTISNLEEVHARGGSIYIMTERADAIPKQLKAQIISIPATSIYTAPILYTIPLQMLAYYVANYRNLDVDQPRNLAKSVTVE